MNSNKNQRQQILNNNIYVQLQPGISILLAMKTGLNGFSQYRIGCKASSNYLNFSVRIADEMQ